MPEDSSTRNDETDPTASFEEWLSRQAADQGISEQELFENLISSYWTLNEMLELLDGSKKPGEELGTEPSGKSVESESGHARRGDTGRPATDERPSGNDRDGEDVSERLDEFDDRIGELRSRLDAEVERGQSLDATVEAIAARLAELDAALEQERDTRESRQQELADNQKKIRSWLDSEFDNLGTILEYLVSKTDDLESDVSSIDARYEDALSRLRWERDTLDSLKRDADAVGTRTAECEACGAEVDLGLLVRPYCPECESTLRSVEDRTKWLVFSDPIVTTGSDRSATPDTGGTEATTERAGSDPRPTTATPPPDPSDEGSVSSEGSGGTSLADAIGSASPFDDGEGEASTAGSESEHRAAESNTTDSEAFGSVVPEDFEGTNEVSTTDVPFEFGETDEAASGDSESDGRGDDVD